MSFIVLATLHGELVNSQAIRELVVKPAQYHEMLEKAVGWEGIAETRGERKAVMVGGVKSRMKEVLASEW